MKFFNNVKVRVGLGLGLRKGYVKYRNSNPKSNPCTEVPIDKLNPNAIL